MILLTLLHFVGQNFLKFSIIFLEITARNFHKKMNISQIRQNRIQNVRRLAALDHIDTNENESDSKENQNPSQSDDELDLNFSFDGKTHDPLSNLFGYTDPIFITNTDYYKNLQKEFGKTKKLAYITALDKHEIVLSNFYSICNRHFTNEFEDKSNKNLVESFYKNLFLKLESRIEVEKLNSMIENGMEDSKELTKMLAQSKEENSMEGDNDGNSELWDDKIQRPKLALRVKSERQK